GVSNNHLLSTVNADIDYATKSVLNSNLLSPVNANVIGVIEEPSTVDFGEIIEMPVYHNNSNIVNFDAIVREQTVHLSIEQQNQLISLLEKHKNVFKDEPDLCKLGEHSINIVNNAVVPKSKMYPVPMCYRSEVSAQIKSLLEQDIIERCTSPYVHPIVCIRKRTAPSDSQLTIVR